MSNKKFRLSVGPDGAFSVQEPKYEEPTSDCTKRKQNLGGRVIVSDENKFRFVKEDLYPDFDEFFDTFYQEIIGMGLTAKNTDKIMKLSEKLIENQKNVLLKILKSENKTNDTSVEIINETSQYMSKQIEQVSTSAKRLAGFRENPMFIEPKGISLGLNWRTKTSSETDLPSNTLVSSTCQFISIADTLKAIFSQQDFQSMYLNYNLNEIHKCESGVYMNFCCGSTYQSKPIYRDPNVIQIQIGTISYSHKLIFSIEWVV